MSLSAVGIWLNFQFLISSQGWFSSSTVIFFTVYNWILLFRCRGKKNKRAILLFYFYLDFTDNTVGRFVNQKINDGLKLGRLEKVFAPYQKMHYSKAKTAL